VIVGSDDPLTAIEEEFSRARRTYDGVFLCTLPAGISRWQQSGIPAQIEAEFGVPLTHVVASSDSVAIQTAGPSLALSQRLGSGGAAIAQLVAGSLGLRYYDWEITAAAAELAGVAPSQVAASERAQTLLERVLDRMGSTGVYLEDESVGRLSSTTMSSAIQALSSSQHRELVEDVVRELASRGGCILVGHAGQVILRDVPRVFKVLITGSAEKRAQRVAADEGRSIEEAAKLVRESDAERRAFFKQTYHVDLLDSSLYDLTLSSDYISSQTVTSIIVDAFKQRSLKLQEAMA
jgi:cytidylate kinase